MARAVARSSPSVSRMTHTTLSPLAHNTLDAPLCWRTHSRNASLPTTDATARASARASLHFGLSPQHPLSPLAHNTLYASLCWRTHSRNASLPTTTLMARAAARSSPLVPRTTHSFSTGTLHPRRSSLLANTLPQRFSPND